MHRRRLLRGLPRCSPLPNCYRLASVVTVRIDIRELFPFGSNIRVVGTVGERHANTDYNFRIAACGPKYSESFADITVARHYSPPWFALTVRRFGFGSKDKWRDENLSLAVLNESEERPTGCRNDGIYGF
jgi:hypothetical protein